MNGSGNRLCMKCADTRWKSFDFNYWYKITLTDELHTLENTEWANLACTLCVWKWQHPHCHYNADFDITPHFAIIIPNNLTTLLLYGLTSYCFRIMPMVIFTPAHRNTKAWTGRRYVQNSTAVAICVSPKRAKSWASERCLWWSVYRHLSGSVYLDNVRLPTRTGQTSGYTGCRVSRPSAQRVN